MKIKHIIGMGVAGVIALFASGCDYGVVPPANMDMVQTAAAQTVEVRLTEAVFETLVAQLTQVSADTSTPLPPTETPLPTATQTSTATETQVSTATSTFTPLPPTATPVPPTNTPVPLPCDWAGFIKDVTVPDGSEFNLSDSFVKTWRLQNIGSCTWTKDYDLVFVSGDSMGGPAAVSIGRNVLPGETVDVSVSLKAPGDKGEYTGYWKLRNASNAIFGLGSNASKNFWVQIKVIDKDKIWDPDNPLNFVSNYCDASWRNSEGNLSCPGTPNNFTAGSVTRTSSPVLEGGYQDDEPALIMIPNNGSNGYISGRYPSIKIKDGDHFTALVGCLDKSPKCDVYFVLNYKADGGSIENLGKWRERSEGKYTRIDINLSSLKGKKVEFILKVENNGSSQDDRAFWLAPKIAR